MRSRQNMSDHKEYKRWHQSNRECGSYAKFLNNIHTIKYFEYKKLISTQNCKESLPHNASYEACAIYNLIQPMHPHSNVLLQISSATIHGLTKENQTCTATIQSFLPASAIVFEDYRLEIAVCKFAPCTIQINLCIQNSHASCGAHTRYVYIPDSTVYR